MLVPLTWKHKSDVTVYIGGVWCLASSLGVTCWRLELVTRQLPGVWPGWPQIRFGLLIDLHPASPFTPSCDCQTVNRQLSVGDILPGLRQCRHYLTSQWDIFIWQPHSLVKTHSVTLFIKRHHFSALSQNILIGEAEREADWKGDRQPKRKGWQTFCWNEWPPRNQSEALSSPHQGQQMPALCLSG